MARQGALWRPWPRQRAIDQSAGLWGASCVETTDTATWQARAWCCARPVERDFVVAVGAKLHTVDAPDTLMIMP